MPLLRSHRFRWSCLGLLLALGVGLWAARDLPRHLVAAALSGRLAARVHLDRLEIQGSGRFRLAGLSVSHLRDYPFVETLRLDEVVVEGSLQGILDSRFERLALRGAEARLAPAPRVEPPDRPLPVIGELILEPASIRVATGGDDLRLCVEAVLWDVGADAGGQARLSAPELELAAIYALIDPAAPPPVAGRLREVAAELSFDAAASRFDARAASARLAFAGGGLDLAEPRWSAEGQGAVSEYRLVASHLDLNLDERRLAAAGPSAAGTVVAGDDGRLDLELETRLPGVAAGELQGLWDPRAERLRRLEARVHGLDLQSLWPAAGLEATAAAVLRGAGDRLEYQVEIALARFAPAPGRELRPAAGSRLRIAGVAPFEPLARLRVPVWDGPVTATISLPGASGRWDDLRLPAALLPLTASADGRWQGGETPRFTGSSRLDSAAGRLAAEGAVALGKGTASADLTWRWTGLDLERLAGLLRDAGLPAPPFAVAGSGEAAGSLRGALGSSARPTLAGRLELRRLGARAAGDADPAWSLSGGQATAAWAWDGARIELPEIEAAGTVAVAGLEPLDLTLRASANAAGDLARGELSGLLEESPESPDAAADSGLGTAHLAGSWRRRGGARTEVSASVHLEALDLGRWQGVAGRLVPSPVLADYRLQGTASAELTGGLDLDLAGDPAAGAWRLAGPARLESAGFVSADGSRVVEGLDSPWQIALRGAPGAPIEAEGHGHLGGFLLLWQTYFGDFSDVRADLTARGRLEAPGSGSATDPSPREEPRRWRLELGASLPQGPTAEGTLESGGDGLRYTLRLDDRDLGATHRRYLASLLEDQLGRLTAGGAVMARVRGSYRAGTPAAWSVIGDLRLRDLRLESGGGQAAVSGLDLDLPLDLRRRPLAELDVSGPRLTGRLAFERLAVRGLELPPTESDLSVEADSLGLEKAIALDLLGGTLTLERLTLNQLLRPSRHLESSIELADISLERISEELELIPLEGALNGHLTGVRLSPVTLSVDGGGEIEAFGGTVSVRDISGQDVLSRFPKLQLSADFVGIDLGALTRRLDFGEMTGTLEGTVEDLELFRGVPVRFSAHLETVHRDGVPRTVDVKAINNITILGTGQQANIFDRGIRSFFNHYTYERLGVTLRLDRDVLLLRGLEHRGERELFLRGRLPLRIDVVNAQPGKTVSFQTMVGRLKSLDFGSATTER